MDNHLLLLDRLLQREHVQAWTGVGAEAFHEVEGESGGVREALAEPGSAPDDAAPEARGAAASGPDDVDVVVPRHRRLAALFADADAAADPATAAAPAPLAPARQPLSARGPAPPSWTSATSPRGPEPIPSMRTRRSTELCL